MKVSDVSGYEYRVLKSDEYIHLARYNMFHVKPIFNLEINAYLRKMHIFYQKIAYFNDN